MTTTIELKVKELKEMTHSEVEEYFNEKCYLSKSDFGLLLSEFIYYTNHDILKIILSSKKFKDNKDCVCEFGSPVVQAMIYAVTAVYAVDTLSDERKLSFKRSIISILSDSAFDLNWNLLDDESNNTLHSALAFTEVFTFDEIETMAKIALSKGIRPINKNGNGDSSFDFAVYGNFSEEDKKRLMNMLTEQNIDDVMEISSLAYEEAVETISAK